MDIRKQLVREIDCLLDNDEITPEEAAFMLGYTEE